MVCGWTSVPGSLWFNHSYGLRRWPSYPLLCRDVGRKLLVLQLILYVMKIMGICAGSWQAIHTAFIARLERQLTFPAP